MAKFLRSTSNPQFTNKNATLDTAEGDNNLIELQAEINEGRGLSAVKIYDNAKEYRLDEFSAHEFNVYKYISLVPASGVVPGTDLTKWVLSSMGEFVLDKNFVVATTAEITALKVAGTLQKGRRYFIDDATLFAARGYYVTVKASAVDKYAINGQLTALNPDYQGVGVYTGVTDYLAQLGVWKTTTGTLDYDTMVNSFVVGDIITGGVSGATAEVVSDAPGSGAVGTLTLKDIVGEFSDGEDISNALSPQATALADGTVTYTFNPLLGNVVIWNGRNYKKKNSVPSSTAPDLDGTNYLELAYSSTTGYITETDEIAIDLNDPDTTALGIALTYDTLIKSRTDSRDNTVFAPLVFQWGNDLVSGNLVNKGGSLDCLNNLQTITNNLVRNSTITANMATNDLLNNTFEGVTQDVSLVVTDVEQDGIIFEAEVTISSADVKTMGGIPEQAIVAPGSGKYIRAFGFDAKAVLIGGDVPYATNTLLMLITDTADTPHGIQSDILKSTVSRTLAGLMDGSGIGAIVASDTQFIEDKALMVSVLAGDPTAGTFDITLRIWYRIVNV